MITMQRGGAEPPSSVPVETPIKSGHSVGPFTFRSILFIQPTYIVPFIYMNNIIIMSIDANVIIALLTLFVSCIPSVWFLLRFRERHQRLREQAIQDSETGFRQSVSYMDSLLLSHWHPVLLALSSRFRCCFPNHLLLSLHRILKRY